MLRRFRYVSGVDVVLFSLIMVFSFCAYDTSLVPAADRTYLALHEPENIIQNLVLCTEARDIDFYLGMLHQDFESRSGLYIIDREKEIASTRVVFDSASEITMMVEEGEWIPLKEWQGKASEDCWQTIRKYSISVIVPGSKEGVLSTDGVFSMVILPVEKDGEKQYKIRALDYIKP